ncbi:MAG: NACHT domain-containing protein, partial [Cyanobacteriota bacterium]|nr:NACHT domain-containing protein [Cyanobacteriota bacterium]
MIVVDDLLVVWGVTQAAGLVLRPILKELVRDAAKDYVKDFFKSLPGDLVKRLSKEPLQKAIDKALKEFFKLSKQELENAGYDEEQLHQYIKPFLLLTKNKDVAAVLGSAFEKDRKAIDIKTLAATWELLDLLPLPDEFDWEFLAKGYLRQVKSIRKEDEELRKILDSENLEAIAAGVEVQPNFDLEKHQEGILEQYGNLNLESLDSSGYAYNELKLWNVFIPQNVRECQEYLPRVLEIPKEHQRRLREMGDLEPELSVEELEKYRQTYFQQSPRSVLEAVKDPSFKYLVILGDPGSGKSTLLQYLALEWANLSPKDRSLHPIPLLIELRRYIRNREEGQCKDFLEFFHKGSGIVCRLPQQELHQRLESGNFLVMFDGLDEVFDRGRREEVITDIHRFTNDYPQLRVIVTSRVVGYKAQKLRDAEFRHFMLEDLEPKQIDNFIQIWHDLTYQDEADKIKKRERLKRSISGSSAIGQLAGNPLLLTMMAILNRNQELPRDRAELYNQASKLLLHQWDVERSLQDRKITIDYRDKQEILRRVA